MSSHDTKKRALTRARDRRTDLEWRRYVLSGPNFILGFVMLAAMFFVLGTPFMAGGANSAVGAAPALTPNSISFDDVARLPSSDELRVKSARVAQAVLAENRLLRVLRAEKVKLSSSELLRNFTPRLDVRQLGRAIMLQGADDTQKLLQQVGLERQQYERLCIGSERDFGLLVSNALLQWAASDGELPAPILALDEITTDHPKELHGEVLRSGLRALATGCLSHHLEVQAKKATVGRLAMR